VLRRALDQLCHDFLNNLLLKLRLHTGRGSELGNSFAFVSTDLVLLVIVNNDASLHLESMTCGPQSRTRFRLLRRLAS